MEGHDPLWRPLTEKPKEEKFKAFVFRFWKYPYSLCLQDGKMVREMPCLHLYIMFIERSRKQLI